MLASIVLVSLGPVRDKARLAKAQSFYAQITSILAIDVSGMWKFEDGSGTEVKDSSGFDNHGTLVNATWRTADQCGLGFGGCVDFDGVDDYVNIPHENVLNGTDALTYTAWFYVEDYAKTHNQIMGKSIHGGGTGRAQMGIWISGAGIIQGRAYTVDLIVCCGHDVIGKKVLKDTWHHTALVFDGTSLKLYLDGKEVASNILSVPTTLSQTTDPLRIGCDYDRCGFAEPPANSTSNYLFDGLIDEVAIYSSALVASQVQQLYVQGLHDHSVAQN